MTTVDSAIHGARGRGLERLDAQLLLGHVLARPRTWVLAHGDEAVDAGPAAAFDALCERRAHGEPLAYLVGEREFHGLRLAVDRRVLVPRPETETLVDWALSLIGGDLRDRPRPVVLDLGTGSGAIALALKSGCPGAQVWAVERSPDALAVAISNAARLGLDVRFAAGDWWHALSPPAAPRAFDLVVGNPPYVAPDDAHLADLSHEPREALVAGAEGMSDIAAIAGGAPGRLAAGAWLLLEHGWTQGPAVQRVLEGAGFAEVETRMDLEGRPRCTGGRWTGLAAG